MTGEYYGWDLTLDVHTNFISSILKKNVTRWWHHKKRCLKLIRSFERLSQELFMPEYQYQNITEWSCHQWLRLSLFKSSSFLGIIPKVSQTKFHQIRMTKLKVFHVQIPASKWKKNGKVGKDFLRDKTGQ